MERKNALRGEINIYELIHRTTSPCRSKLKLSEKKKFGANPLSSRFAFVGRRLLLAMLFFGCANVTGEDPTNIPTNMLKLRTSPLCFSSTKNCTWQEKKNVRVTGVRIFCRARILLWFGRFGKVRHLLSLLILPFAVMTCDYEELTHSRFKYA